MTDSGVELILSLFGEMVASDGGKITLIGHTGNTLKVKYSPGQNYECADCVISPGQLQELLSESVKVHAPYITKVEVVS